ncbi:hypothetical protein [Rasiella sp. SM2506]|uniref:hypothetical protein n=1 Tax=Rasiella sp. SM2506 TaxID=3423914 RepID=UPI003D79E192
MKTIPTAYILLILSLVGNLVFAQTNSNIKSSVIEVFKNEGATLNFLSSQQERFTNNSQNISTSNAVYIQQVGNYNAVASTTQSLSSDINLFQIGNRNEVVLGVKAASINENVIQQGVNNSFLDVSTNGSIFHAANVIQQGTNQNLIWLGDNSISKNMLVRMRGNGQTVLVRNIK